MRILLFAQHFAEYVLTLAQGFGPEVELMLVLASDNIAGEIPAGMACPLRVEALAMPGPARPAQLLAGVLRYRRLLRQFQPDVVHFQEMPKGFSFACWLASRAWPRVLTVHDVSSHPGQDAKSSWRQDAIRRHMRASAQALVLHGQALLEQLRRLSPSLAAHAHVVPHPAMRVQRAPTPPAGKSLLFFGRIARYKGLRPLLEACLLLQARGQDFELVVAGSGDELEPNRALLSQVRQLRLLARRIAPDEIDALFQQCALVLLPYIEASQSGVAAYALGFGRPCVASRCGSLPEVIRHGHNGLLCAPGDVQGLADALQSLLNDPARLARFAAQAHALARGELAPQEAARLTLQLYRRMAPLGALQLADGPIAEQKPQRQRPGF